MDKLIKTCTKKEAEELRWAQLPTKTARKGTPLTGVNVKGATIAGCDGFRLHRVAGHATDLEDGTWLVNNGKPVSKTPGAYEVEAVAGQYPDYERVRPVTQGDIVEQVIEFGIDPKFLREALEMPNDGKVIIRVWRNTGEYATGRVSQITVDNGDNCEAVVMCKEL